MLAARGTEGYGSQPGGEDEDRRSTLSRAFSSLLFLVYIVIGAVVAASNNYFERLNSVKPIASAALAVLLWPLVLFGVNLHLK